MKRMLINGLMLVLSPAPEHPTPPHTTLCGWLRACGIGPGRSHVLELRPNGVLRSSAKVGSHSGLR
jgi:hypothetical protein